jgi:hypothetical protein
MKNLIITFFIALVYFIWYGMLFIACLPWVIVKLIYTDTSDFDDSDCEAQSKPPAPIIKKNQHQLFNS